MRTAGADAATAATGESGAATVLVVAMAGLLCFVAIALMGAGGLVTAQRRAQSAADLAALAGAVAVRDGADGCAAAGLNATANGAQLIGCEETDGSLLVTVSVAAPRLVGAPDRVTAQARAGQGQGVPLGRFG